MDDMTRFVQNNFNDDPCRCCGSYECYGCACTWCLEHPATKIVPDKFGRDEQLCEGCAMVAVGDLGRKITKEVNSEYFKSLNR